MKSLAQFITEDKKRNKIRKKIVFDIWESPGVKIQDLKSNTAYQKIVCTYQEGKDYGMGLSVEFLLGFKDGTWQLWAGKPGVVIYSDDSYADLETDVFYRAVNKAVDKCVELILQVKAEPNNWAQYYTDI